MALGPLLLDPRLRRQAPRLWRAAMRPWGLTARRGRANQAAVRQCTVAILVGAEVTYSSAVV